MDSERFMDNESEKMDNERFTDDKSEKSCCYSDNEEPINLELQQLASHRLNRHCIHTHRLRTGGLHNEFYLLQFETGPDCIAQLSRNLIPSASKIASEVATLKYVAKNTSIKVPAVYDWDCTSQNPINTPYIFMEWLPGQNLYQVWFGLTVEQKKGVLSQIIDILLELMKCQFEEIGCIYMDESVSIVTFIIN
jgi:hypothetical protein